MTDSEARPPSAASADHSGTQTFVRFRDRVRTRIGTAELLAFQLGRERFAFDVRALDEAIDSPSVERVPMGGASLLAGLMRHAGHTIPVFDTGRVLGVQHESIDQVLVMRSGARRIGLLVDEIDDVINVPLASIKPTPVETGDDLLLGVLWDGTHLTSILDARALITFCQQRASEVIA